MVLTYNMLPFLLDDAHFGAKMLKNSRNCAKSCGKDPQNKSEKIPKLACGPPNHPTIRSRDFFLIPLITRGNICMKIHRWT